MDPFTVRATVEGLLSVSNARGVNPQLGIASIRTTGMQPGHDRLLTFRWIVGLLLINQLCMGGTAWMDIIMCLQDADFAAIVEIFPELDHEGSPLWGIGDLTRTDEALHPFVLAYNFCRGETRIPLSGRTEDEQRAVDILKALMSLPESIKGAFTKKFSQRRSFDSFVKGLVDTWSVPNLELSAFESAKRFRNASARQIELRPLRRHAIDAWEAVRQLDTGDNPAITQLVKEAERNFNQAHDAFEASTREYNAAMNLFDHECARVTKNRLTRIMQEAGYKPKRTTKRKATAPADGAPAPKAPVIDIDDDDE
jgi:hypothetical protein